MRTSDTKPAASATPSAAVKWWLISCDDSGLHGARYYAYGTLWMAWQRRGDFQDQLRALRERHGYQHELKWTRVTRHSLPFFLDVVDWFFDREWMQFHCYLLEKAIIDRELHHGDFDLARRKHLTLFLVNKMRRCLQRHRGRTSKFRVWIDPIASRYQKADEAVEVIGRNLLAQRGGHRDCLDGVHTRDSKETPSIQLTDLLLGAVCAAHLGKTDAEAKQGVQAAIAARLGWDDLRADTKPQETKFNIWVFHDPRKGARRPITRPVVLAPRAPAGT